MLARDLPHDVFTLLFSEQGPFEQLSIVLWALLGAALLLKRPLPLCLRLATAAVAFAFAAREADLHKAYTVMSITKIKFYWSPEVPLPQKLAGGLVLLTLIALLVFLTVQLYGYVVRRRGLLTPMGQVMALPVLMLPVSKVIDRLPSQLYEMFQIVFPLTVQQLLAAFEEGMEMAMPLLFLVALLLHRPARADGRSGAAQRRRDGGDERDAEAEHAEHDHEQAERSVDLRRQHRKHRRRSRSS